MIADCRGNLSVVAFDTGNKVDAADTAASMVWTEAAGADEAVAVTATVTATEEE